jgi:fructose-specific phosphotransferase system IIC component
MTKQFFKQTLTLATASFGVVAALAWNSAIQALIQRIYPEPVAGVRSAFLYAVIITTITVAVTYWAGQVDARIEGKNHQSVK